MDFRWGEDERSDWSGNSKCPRKFGRFLHHDKVRKQQGSDGVFSDLDAISIRPSLSSQMINDLKFAQCIPREIAISTIEARILDNYGIESTLARRRRLVRICFSFRMTRCIYRQQPRSVRMMSTASEGVFSPSLRTATRTSPAAQHAQVNEPLAGFSHRAGGWSAGRCLEARSLQRAAPLRRDWRGFGRTSSSPYPAR